jgi:hypothetical protein
MDFVLFLVLIIALYGCHLRKEEDGSFMDRKQTSAVNGIFVMLVFLNHFKQYVAMGKYDGIFQKFAYRMEQLIVVTFLFYSGYGIMLSIMNKKNYVKTVPLRFLKLLIHFDLALLFYLIGGLVIGVRFPISTYLLALIGWDTIGNSTWFIFATLCLYVFVYIAGIIAKDQYKVLVTLVSIESILFIILLDAAGKSDYWFNTVLCFPAGMLFALFYEIITKAFDKKILYIANILISFGICLLCHKLPWYIDNSAVEIFLYEIKSIAFAWTIVSVTWILVIGNPVLKWLGGYVFEIYILQRFPMTLLINVAVYKYLYFALSLALTLAMAIAFKKAEDYIDGIINRKGHALK